MTPIKNWTVYLDDPVDELRLGRPSAQHDQVLLAGPVPGDRDVPNKEVRIILW